MTLSKRILLMAATLLIVLGAGATLAQDNDGRPPNGPPGQMAPAPPDGAQPPASQPMPQAAPADGERPPNGPPGQTAPADGERPPVPPQNDAGQNRPFGPRRPASTYYYASAICSPTPRLEGETQGEVAQSYSSLRQAIGSSVVLTIMPGGAIFDILDGPVCSGAHYWYQVSYNGLVGWVTEGMGNVYWLEPVDLD